MNCLAIHLIDAFNLKTASRVTAVSFDSLSIVDTAFDIIVDATASRMSTFRLQTLSPTLFPRTHLTFLLSTVKIQTEMTTVDGHFLIACRVHCHAFTKLGIESLGGGDEVLAGDGNKLRLMLV